MEDIILGATGMVLDANPNASNAPRFVLNAVCRKPGVIEPRPGFDTTRYIGTGSNGNGGIYVAKLLKAKTVIDAVVAAGLDEVEAVNGYRIYEEPDASTAEYTADDSATLYFSSPAYIWSAESRNNIYYGIYGGESKTASGIRGREIGDAATGSLVRAGYPGFLPPVYFTQTTGTATAILTGKYVSYRFTLENKLGEVLRVSIPSPRKIIGGYVADTDMQVQCNLPSSAVAGDTLKLYRTVNNDTVAVSDQHFLQSVHELTSADISAGYYTVTDATADDDLRDALYTNPERGGLLASNYRPPACKVIEDFQGSLLFGNIAQPHRIKLRFTTLYADRTGQSTGIGYRDTTGTITGLGAATVTGATTTGLKVGMILSDTSGWTGSGPVRITAINGGTLTLSHTYAGASGSFAGKYWYDSIRVSCTDGSGEDRYFPSFLALVPTRNVFEYYFMLTNATTATTRMAAAGVYAVGDMTVNADGVSMTGEMTLEKYQPGGQPLEIWATHGDEYDPVLPEPTVANGEESTADVWEDAVFWSRRHEPEHVPLLNYARVGRLGSPILRMLRGQDCVWLFKADGVYRLSGFGERSGFRVDPVYPELILRTPGSADQMGGTVYANTNRGIVRFAGAGGYEMISSTPLRGYLAPYDDAMGVANESTCFATFVVCNPTHSEVVVGVGDADECCSLMYVFNANTNSWAQWGGDDDATYGGSSFLTDMISSAISHPSDGLLRLAMGVLAEDYNLRVLLELADETDEYPNGVDFLVNIAGQATADGITYTYSSATDLFGNSYTIKVGDLVFGDSSNTRRVVIDASAGTFTLNSAMGELGTVIPYAAFASAVQWNARGLGHPGTVKQFSSGSVFWGQLAGVARWTWRVYSDVTRNEYVDATQATEYNHEQDDVRALTGDVYAPSNARRVWTPRGYARASAIFPEVIVCQGGSRWQLHGIAVTARPLSTRVARRVGT